MSSKNIISISPGRLNPFFSLFLFLKAINFTGYNFSAI
jgi:hypothetical protein